MIIEKEKKKVALVKIAPGERAKLWDECRHNGYICVGWDAVGDLRQYDSKSDYLRSFEKEYKRSTYHGNLSTTRRKANEVWLLTKLRPGDRVVANKGMKQILAIGTVRKPGYVWKGKKHRQHYRHTVKVKWDTSLATEIAPQPWNQTVVEVPYPLFKSIAGRSAPPRNDTQSLEDRADSKQHFSPSASLPAPGNTESVAARAAEEDAEKRGGFQSNPKIRRAVELHAMKCVTEELKRRGHSVADKSKNNPFDLLCTRSGKTTYVEVKGTQGVGSQVILTAGEVKFIKKNAPNCVLYVVTEISVTGNKKPKASGGKINTDGPFYVARGSLTPLAFSFHRGS